MSYILDALRKAEAERERGQLPGLHSTVALPLLSERHLLGRLTPGWPLPGLGVVLGLLVVAAGWGWQQRRGDADAPTLIAERAASERAKRPVEPTAPVAAALPAVKPATPQTPIAPTVPTAPSTTTAPAAQTTPSTPTAVASAQAGPGVIDARSRPALAVVASPSAAGATSATTVSTPTPAVTSASAATATPPAAAAVAPPADGRIHAVDDLPADIRRELPKLDFGGLVQLDNPPRRSLIVNGAILMEGELVQPNLLLEQIRLNGAVLRYKGWRYQLPL